MIVFVYLFYYQTGERSNDYVEFSAKRAKS